MSRLRVYLNESNYVDWRGTAELAQQQRDAARARLQAEWATLSVQDVRALGKVLDQAEEALKAAAPHLAGS